MEVPLIDLRREYRSLQTEIDSAVLSVMAHTQFINGPEVRRFEEASAKYLGCRYAIGVASGTDALLIALRAVGVGPGTEVITTAFSFFATAGTIHNLGAKPVFVDIEPATFNIDASQVEARITPRTKAIMPVHLFGQSADMDAILGVAIKHKLAVIEDAAQSISAKYRGRMSGTVGTLGCYSFFPTKNLGCPGDGGMIVTDSEELATAVRKLKAHGAAKEYHHEMVGYNSRLDTLHAAVLLAKLPYLDRWAEARRRNAAYYDQRFKGTSLIPPAARDYAYHIYNQYTVRHDRRDELKAFLKDRGVGTKVYYPSALHLQDCFAYLGYRAGDLPNSELCAQQVLSLPIYPDLTAAEREYVAAQVVEFVSR